MNWLIKNFLRGLVIVVPIALTVYLVYQSFRRLDELLRRVDEIAEIPNSLRRGTPVRLVAE